MSVRILNEMLVLSHLVSISKDILWLARWLMPPFSTQLWSLKQVKSDIFIFISYNLKLI
mgnify:CR=1 FL=1